MNEQHVYDVAIVGGGVAGLALSIQLAKQGHSVIVCEKEKYPFHKVCGEYISLESFEFVKSLGLQLDQWQVPIIDTLFLTAPNGKSFTTTLPLGGFGMSRFFLDHQLFEIAKRSGAIIKENCKVDQIIFDDRFHLRAGAELIHAKVCCAAYGKRSNIDVKWDRAFLSKYDKRLDNFLAVKYHIQGNWPQNVIGLHNFENGYCGISKIEADKYCLCYMTKAEILKQAGNDIKQLEKNILHINPHLKKIFSESKAVPGFPITISQINFNTKPAVEHGVLMIGDAAGMITPLCGNGMSIGFHTSKIATGLIHQFLKGKINRKQLEEEYTIKWQHAFSRRLKTGRLLQKFFGNKRLSNFFVSSFQAFPFLAKPMIRITHGKPF